MTWIGLVVSVIFSLFFGPLVAMIIVPSWDYDHDAEAKIIFWIITAVMFFVLMAICFGVSTEIQQSIDFKSACRKLAQSDTELPSTLSEDEKYQIYKNRYENKTNYCHSSGSGFALGYVVGKSR